ncbi:MAG: MOSC domain-containing protein [Terriglobia bacterium]
MRGSAAGENERRQGVSGSRVVALYVSPARAQAMVARQQVQALANHGFADDAHARPGSRRQVLLLDAETLKEFSLRPGSLKENITTLRLKLARLAPGTRLRLGEALLEITKPCEPCSRMNQIRPGLQAKLHGRRGMLARVLTGGRIRVGDAIEVFDPAASPRD